MSFRKFGGRGFGGRGESRRPIPVKEGDTYDVEIESVGEKGDGIGKIEGYVVIVPNIPATLLHIIGCIYP